MNPALVALLINELPSLLGFIRGVLVARGTLPTMDELVAERSRVASAIITQADAELASKGIKLEA